MAKVVRAVALVAAVVVNVIPGAGQAISAGIFAAVGVTVAATTALAIATIGLASIATLAAKKGKPALATGSTGLTSRVSIDPDIAQWIVIGETGLPTQLIYFGTSGTNNENLSMIFAHGCHTINAFTGLNLNNITTAFPTPAGAYAGILSIETATGTQTANPFTSVNGGQWGAAQIGRDLAISHFRWTYDSTKLASGLPQNIQFIGQGIRVYDPRRDSTRGGSGSMRANDETTWAYSVSGDAIGRNPALVHISYRLGWRKNGRLWAGMGEDPANLDYASYIAAANVCDETVAGAPRYRIDGLISLADIHNVNLGKIEATCAGRSVDTGGLLGFWAAHDDTAVAVMALNDGDWVGDIGWQPLIEGEVRNTARGNFIDPASFYQSTPYLEVAPSDLRSLDNGEELADTLDFAMVQSAAQARRLASIRLRESRQGRFIAPAALKTLGLRPTQVCSVTRDRTSWGAKRFRVESMALSIDKTQLTMREVQSSDYADVSTGAVTPPASLPTIGYIPVGVSLTDPILSNLSPTTGNALPGFVASDGNPFNRIVDSGEARDGDVITFAATLPAIPAVTFLYGGNAASAGNNIVTRADGLNSSGFTAVLKGQSVSVGSTITDTGSTAGTGGEPARVINRTNSGAPYDGRYTFRYPVNVGNIAPGEPGTIEVGIYVKKSGSWVQVGTAYHSATGTYNFTVTPGAVDFGAGNEFGIGVISATGSGTALTNFTSVKYTLGTVTETSLTPTGASPIKWEARL